VKLDSLPNPAAIGITTVRELPPNALALLTTTVLLLIPCNSFQYLCRQRRTVVLEIIETLSLDYSCRHIRVSGMLWDFINSIAP
jgi:hypothetical protein